MSQIVFNKFARDVLTESGYFKTGEYEDLESVSPSEKLKRITDLMKEQDRKYNTYTMLVYKAGNGVMKLTVPRWSEWKEATGRDSLSMSSPFDVIPTYDYAVSKQEPIGVQINPRTRYKMSDVQGVVVP